MKDLKRAFAEAELLAVDATERAKGGSLYVSEVWKSDSYREHCFDPWVIARVLSRAHDVAAVSLKRSGFEMWFPAGRRFRLMPKRHLTRTRRNSRRVVLREELERPYGDYVFVRRLFGDQSLWRLFELNGVLGVCAFGEKIATVPDFEIEMLRLYEYDGRFDRCDFGISAKQFQLAEIVRTRAALQRSKSDAEAFKILDANGEAVHFIEQFGRITRVVTATGSVEPPTLSDPCTEKTHATGSAKL